MPGDRGTGGAGAEPQQLCRQALTRVEREMKIPAGLLQAIGQAESSHWPWSLNIAGKPHRYADRAAAEAALIEGLKKTRNVDIGCVQVNARWHGTEVGAPALFLDPDLNAAYAGWHLVDLWQGRTCRHSWSCAVRHYFNAPTEAERAAYECRTAIAWAAGTGRPKPACEEK